MTNFLLIANTQSGSFDKETLADAVASFEKAGHSVNVAETFHKGDGAKIMADADPEKNPSVIVAGGGGLVSEVIDALMNRDDYDKFTFGIIPMGALNVLALEMGLTEPNAAVAAICSELRRDYPEFGKHPYSGVTIDFEGLYGDAQKGFKEFPFSGTFF